MKLRALLLLAPLLLAPPLLAPRAFAEGEEKKAEAEAEKKAQSCDLTMHQYMEKKIRAAIKDKTLSKEDLDKKLAVYLSAIADLAPEASWNEGPKSWKKITEAAVEKKDWSSSCKTCHDAYKEKYKKGYGKKKICVDPEAMK